MNSRTRRRAPKLLFFSILPSPLYKRRSFGARRRTRNFVATISKNGSRLAYPSNPQPAHLKDFKETQTGAEPGRETWYDRCTEEKEGQQDSAPKRRVSEPTEWLDSTEKRGRSRVKATGDWLQASGAQFSAGA